VGAKEKIRGRVRVRASEMEK